MKKTGIVRDDRYMSHKMGRYHPECPQRLESIYNMLDKPNMKKVFTGVPARKAKREELAAVHDVRYIDMLASTEGRECTYLDPDTQTSAESYSAALLAAGGLCEAAAMVISGEIDNAFALVRPPGHHAESSRAMGFCLFNNIAVAARYAQQTLGIKRILIADWDLHHGNGTQHTFENDSSILYFSTHQYPYYPGTGAWQEVGTEGGKGFTINVPLTTGYGDSEYATIYEKILKPVAAEFKPELILVSAGFDTYIDDPLGGMKVTSEGYACLTRILMDIAESCCQGRIVMTLEGGYNIAGQTESVKSVLLELADLKKSSVADMILRAEKRLTDLAISPVMEIHSRYWKSLKK